MDPHLPCHACGYDLHLQPADAVCPECGRPIAESLMARQPMPARHRQLLRCMVEISVLCLAAPFVVFFLPWDRWIGNPPFYGYHISIFGPCTWFPLQCMQRTALTAACIAGAGWLFMSGTLARQPSLRRHRPTWAYWLLVGAAALLCLGLGLFADTGARR